ncbi:transcription factor SFP1-like isoform X6 [Haliotis rubra]|uniref:transcription factor SFP1-like isoform X6 n=1 Tax=Haliotis rubra TaxID=36100 RepID=UPI001EE592C3|nr:transcription factor SFP1-like isoform X6 [Haliotis rubra]
MFIETLEFTIPIDLCSLCATLQKGSSDMEFPASVNSYGTTQDANISVLVKSNKLTFKVDGVSSGASVISKSECKTLKLSVFDVDRSLMPQESTDFDLNSSSVDHSLPTVNPGKRTHEQSVTMPVQAKSSRNSFHDSPKRTKTKSPNPRRGFSFQNSQHSSNNIRPLGNVTVKTEPGEPDLIEIEPPPQTADGVKKEVPYMQIDFSSDVPHTQTSQSALDRLSHTQPTHSPGSSSSSYQQNVPHVPDYTKPSTSQAGYSDQNADDFLVFQDENDDGDDNEVDFSNDGHGLSSDQDLSRHSGQGHLFYPIGQQSLDPRLTFSDNSETFSSMKRQWQCDECGKSFTNPSNKKYHMEAVHGIGNVKTYVCVCGKVYKYPRGLFGHRKKCAIAMEHGNNI